MMEEPESLILRILRQMRAELGSKPDLEAALHGEFATKSVLEGLRAELKSEMHSLRADFASDLLSMRKEFSDQIVGLRRAEIDYHTSVMGHGQ
jgi:hypothetical protein